MMTEELVTKVQEAVSTRLAMLGITGIDATADGFRFLIELNNAKILSEINHEALPTELEPFLVDSVTGDYLASARLTGALGALDLSGAVESIKEGDVSVTLAKGFTDAQKLDWLIDYLLKRGESVWAAYRKMRW